MFRRSVNPAVPTFPVNVSFGRDHNEERSCPVAACNLETTWVTGIEDTNVQRWKGINSMGSEYAESGQ
ncbi:MAG: hypothetical protein JNM91_05815, partial [Flavobacteriales bacterium]|nr:hypothetical protein [Flavobacteriales bacterium]